MTQRICCNAYVWLSNNTVKTKHLRVGSIILSDLSKDQLNRKYYSI